MVVKVQNGHLRFRFLASPPLSLPVFCTLVFSTFVLFLGNKKMPLNALITRIVETCSYHFLPRWSGAPGRKVPRNVGHGREKMVTGLSCSKHG